VRINYKVTSMVLAKFLEFGKDGLLQLEIPKAKIELSRFFS